MRAALALVLFVAAALAGPPPASPSAPAGGEAAGVERWNLYVDLANDLEAVFLPALDAYREAFGQGPEYHGGSGFIVDYFMSLTAEPEEFGRVMALALEAAEAGPEGELDAAAREMSPYLPDLWANLLRSRDFQLEKPPGAGAAPEPAGESLELRAKLDGPEDLHARIFVDGQGFAAAHDRFREVLKREGLKRRERDIQALRADGFVVRSAMLSLLDAGQALQDFLNVRRAASVRPARLTPEELAPFLAGLEREAKLFETARAGPGEREGLSAETLAEFSAGLGAALSAAAALAAREDGPEPAGEPEPAEEKLALEIGRLVDIYNRME